MATSESRAPCVCRGVKTPSPRCCDESCEGSMAERPPRVVFAIGTLARGGSERQLVQLIESAHPNLLEATVLVYSDECDPGHMELLRERGVDVIQVAPTSGPRPLRPAISVPRTLRILRR